MKLTFRWYGPKDSIPLDYIRQAQEIVDESSVQREIVRRLNNVLGILCL